MGKNKLKKLSSRLDRPSSILQRVQISDQLSKEEIEAIIESCKKSNDINSLFSICSKNIHDSLSKAIVEDEKLFSFIKRYSEYMHWFVERGHANAIKTILDKEENIKELRQKAEDGMTALLIAARLGFVDIVNTIIEKHPETLEDTSKDGFTALHMAIRGNHPDVVKTIIEKHPETLKDKDQNKEYTALLIAARLGFVDIVNTIIEKHPETLEDTSKYGASPLHIAAVGNKSEAVSIIIAKCPSILQRVCEGVTALHVAVRLGFVDVVKTIIEKHPETLKDTSNDGLTALHMAIKENNFDVARAIIGKDCDTLEHKISNGSRAVHLAAEIDNLEMFKLVAGKCHNIYEKAIRGSSILHLAARHDHPEIISYIIRNYPNLLQQKDDLGLRPIDHASIIGCKGSFEILLESEISTDDLQEDYSTLLNHAILNFKRNSNILDSLLQRDGVKIDHIHFFAAALIQSDHDRKHVFRLLNNARKNTKQEYDQEPRRIDKKSRKDSGFRSNSGETTAVPDKDVSVEQEQSHQNLQYLPVIKIRISDDNHYEVEAIEKEIDLDSPFYSSLEENNSDLLFLVEKEGGSNSPNPVSLDMLFSMREHLKKQDRVLSSNSFSSLSEEYDPIAEYANDLLINPLTREIYTKNTKTFLEKIKDLNQSIGKADRKDRTKEIVDTLSKDKKVRLQIASDFAIGKLLEEERDKSGRGEKTEIDILFVNKDRGTKYWSETKHLGTGAVLDDEIFDRILKRADDQFWKRCGLVKERDLQDIINLLFLIDTSNICIDGAKLGEHGITKIISNNGVRNIPDNIDKGETKFCIGISVCDDRTAPIC